MLTSWPSMRVMMSPPSENERAWKRTSPLPPRSPAFSAGPPACTACSQAPLPTGSLKRLTSCG